MSAVTVLALCCFTLTPRGCLVSPVPCFSIGSFAGLSLAHSFCLIEAPPPNTTSTPAAFFRLLTSLFFVVIVVVVVVDKVDLLSLAISCFFFFSSWIDDYFFSICLLLDATVDITSLFGVVVIILPFWQFMSIFLSFFSPEEKKFVWRASIMRFCAVLVSAWRRVQAGIEPAGQKTPKKAR